MPASPRLPEGYVLRPATLRDRWQIHRLLHSFEQELITPPHPLLRLLQYGFLGGMVAIGIHWILTLGLEAVLYLLGTMAFLWISLQLVFIGAEDWAKFWVVEHEHRVIACAKLCHADRYSTLYNVLVAADWRGRGVGSYLVEQMTLIASKPLYLACNPDKISFYAQFGFVETSPKQLNLRLRYELGLTTRRDIVPLVLGEAN